MSTSIDQRVVEMSFNNKEFESNVSTSLKTLDNLKKGLDLSNSAKGLDSVNESARKVSFDGISNGLESVKLKFSALQVIAVTALSNITNSIINAGKNMISSLTVDPISSGLDQYETKINAIQTILTNTSSKGTTIDQVNAALKDLNNYSDKTIYNFSEMARNIGTFTAAGVDLKTSTESIKGIANLAAGSGSSAEQASTAMYQLSQAIAAGSVKLQDWNSVVNAGMGGEMFQKALEKTAVELGHGRDMSKSFRDSLQDGWITAQVLTTTLSKMANDASLTQAATQVKTFTQLFDTMRESVQSGWAISWEHIIGNKDEAAKSLTAINDAFGGITGASAAARNSMLQFWHDNGGRDALIQAITNAFTGLNSIIKPVSEAFKDIFPPMTGQQLVNITKSLQSLTAEFKIGDTTASELKSTFKGLFAVFDIGGQLISAILNGIGSMFKSMDGLGGGVLKTTASWGEWLASLDNTIRKTDVFNKAIQTVVTGVGTMLTTVKNVFNTIGENISNIVEKISQYFNFDGFILFHSFLEVLNKRMSQVGDAAGGMRLGITDALTAMGEAVANSKFMKVFEILWNFVQTVVKGVIDLLGKLADSFVKAFKDTNFNGILDLIAGISIGGLALSISKFLKNITAPLEESKGILKQVTGILDGVRGCFEAYQLKLKADVLLKISIAIAILAASIVAISLIDSAKLVTSLGAITTLFGELLVAMAIFNKISADSNLTLKSSAALIAMSLSILILSGAMKELASLDWNGIAKGAVGIAALSTILVTSANLLSGNEGKMMKGATGLILFAEAIKVLAEACIILAALSWDGLAKGLIGVGVLIAEISLFLNNTTFSAKSIITATGIVILAAAIKILASACGDFATMSWESIAKGLTSVGLLLTEISLFTNLTGNATHVVATGVALVLIGAALKIVASALQDFGSMSWEGIAKGLVAMAGALVEIGIAMNFMPNNMILTGAGLVIVASALDILAGVLVKMGAMSWESIAKGLTTMGGALLILSIGLNTMTGTLAGSAALLVAAIALAILAPTLSLLGAMSWEGITKGLTTLAGTFIVLGVAGLLLAPLVPAILALSAALVLLGVGLIGIGAGLLLVGAGLTALSVGFGALATMTAAGATAIVAALTIIIVGVAALIPAIMAKLGEGIIAMCKVLTDGIPTFCTAIVTIVTAVIAALITTVPLVVNGVLQILSSVLDALIKWGPKILQQVLDLALSLLKVLADNLPKFVDAGVNVCIAFIQGIANKMADIIQAGFDLLLSFINGMTNGINTNTPKLVAAMDGLIRALVQAGVDVLIGSLTTFLNCGGDLINNLVSGMVGKKVNATGAINDMLVSCKNSIVSYVSEFMSAGSNIVSGFINGIRSKINEAAAMAANLAMAALAAAKAAIGIHSPSRAFAEVGSYAGEGFVNGLNGYSSKVADSAADMAIGALDSITSAISSVSDIITNGIDTNPTIKPVLDLSNIVSGTKTIDSLLSANQSVSAITQDKQNQTSQSTDTSTQQSTDTSTASSGSSITQTVYIYSPTALSPAETARQNTRSLQELALQL